VLKVDRMRLYLDFSRELTDAETQVLRELVVRRGTREPLQQIVGSTSFCGFPIRVNRSVLVPRPETELLAEHAWEYARKLASEAEAQGQLLKPIRCLDFGTGSGCLAIAIAAKCPVAQVLAIDVSAEALELAHLNALENQVADRIEFVQAAGLETSGQRFDLLVSNPPYIPRAEIASLDAEVRDFEPFSALDGGEDGLDFFRRLATGAAGVLEQDAPVFLEFGDGQAAALREIFETQNWIVEAIHEDYTQRPRILVARPSE
jgi:release factor glutamine methyltransferase